MAWVTNRYVPLVQHQSPLAADQNIDLHPGEEDCDDEPRAPRGPRAPRESCAGGVGAAPPCFFKPTDVRRLGFSDQCGTLACVAHPVHHALKRALFLCGVLLLAVSSTAFLCTVDLGGRARAAADPAAAPAAGAAPLVPTRTSLGAGLARGPGGGAGDIGLAAAVAPRSALLGIPGAADEPEVSGVILAQCHTATRGDKCFDMVVWAMNHGYLWPLATFEDFQLRLYQGGHEDCPQPCTTAGSEPRLTRRRGK
mmetsp:Transcript_5850/g.16634  ORF Transcript_5850/g.16634 Transcript_5850/m.16634 type:complete len:253 (-) Transcript_5850:18-776(-)